MASVFYNSFKVDIQSGNIDIDTDTIKCALVTSTYTPNIDTDTKWSNVTNEVSGTGYTAGGATLASVTVTQDNTNDRGVVDAADVTWSTATITARAAVLYKSTGTASTSPLICYIDFGSDQTSSGGNFVIQWNASGIFALT